MNRSLLVANLRDNALRHNIRGGRVKMSTATWQGRIALTVVN